jgi:hypothetical protein
MAADQTQEAGTVCACATAAEEAEQGDRAADDDEGRGKPVKDHERPARGQHVEQLDVDVGFSLQPHPEPHPDRSTAQQLYTTTVM